MGVERLVLMFLFSCANIIVNHVEPCQNKCVSPLLITPDSYNKNIQ
jgi:hypothetical protein